MNYFEKLNLNIKILRTLLKIKNILSIFNTIDDFYIYIEDATKNEIKCVLAEAKRLNPQIEFHIKQFYVIELV